MRNGAVASLVACLLVPPVSAQSPAGPSGSVGLLVVAHGADSGWNARVRQVVAEVEWAGPRAVAFLMGPEAESAGWNAALETIERVGATRLVVVPLMVSSHGAHHRQVQFYAGVVDTLPVALDSHVHAVPRRPSMPTSVTGAIDAAPELAEIMLARWRSLPVRDRKRDLVLVAHGPNGDEDAQRWHQELAVALAPLRHALGRHDLRVGLLRDDAPRQVRAAAVAGLRDTIQALSDRASDSVAVLTVLVSAGSIDRKRVPEDLAGTPMRYLPSVLAPHPALAAWIARMATAELRR